jgi:UDP-N-acetylmuramate dehydrogenase
MAKGKKRGMAKPKAARAKAPKAGKPAAKARPGAREARGAPARKTAAPAPARPPAPAAKPPARAAGAATPATARPAARTPGAPAKAGSAAAAAPRRSGPQLPAGLAGAVRYDEPLAKHTTFRIGGPATVLFAPADPESAAAALAWARSAGLPWLVLGAGSNVLIRDGGFRGLVLKLGKGMDDVVVKGATWTVGAGVPTPILARRSAEAGLEGLQRLIGVPGSVGGGVFMNSGAHGQDYAGVLVSAQVLTPKGEMKVLPRSAITFGYRRSGLDGHVVLGAVLRFEEEDPVRLRNDMAMVMKRRRAGTPFDQPCCGSVFRNPEGRTAGRLIDRCGLKGRRVGGAMISPLHANYIVNKGGATADDVLRLIDIARTAVFKEFGHELQLEVRVIGEAK